MGQKFNIRSTCTRLAPKRTSMVWRAGGMELVLLQSPLPLFASPSADLAVGSSSPSRGKCWDYMEHPLWLQLILQSFPSERWSRSRRARFILRTWNHFDPTRPMKVFAGISLCITMPFTNQREHCVIAVFGHVRKLEGQVPDYFIEISPSSTMLHHFSLTLSEIILFISFSPFFELNHM